MGHILDVTQGILMCLSRFWSIKFCFLVYIYIYVFYYIYSNSHTCTHTHTHTHIFIYVCMYMSSLVAPLVENLPTTQETTCQCKRCGNSPWVRKSPWRWKWLPTPVFLPGKSQRQRILEGYRPWGLKSSIKLIYIYSSNLMTHCNKWEGLATLEHSLL